MKLYRVWSLRSGAIDPPELLDEEGRRRQTQQARNEELAWRSINQRVDQFYAERRRA